MWITLGIITYLLFWVTCILSYTIHYLTDTIQITSFSQVIYTLNSGTEGAESTIGTAVLGFFTQYWLLLIIGTLVFILYIRLCIRRNKLKKSGQPLFKEKKTVMAFNCSAIAAALITVSLLGYRVNEGYNLLGIGDYLANSDRVSDLYETEFIEPTEVDITFPAKKRNLIHIVLESMESSYTDPAHGGAYTDDLIPELYGLAKTGTDFSRPGTTDLNGALVTDNSGWTIAGLVAQSAAVPLNVGNAEFNGTFKDDLPFMPHLTTLGEILEDAGYHNYFMCGSKGAYAGRSNYYKQHGNYEILDHDAAIREKVIPSDYWEWWGLEDAKMIPWAESKLTEIAKNDQPFNFTMLTVDTHFQDGYLCPDCPEDYDNQYDNVIACSDHRVAEFVKWIQQQDFYKDTTIVISGDHLSMDGSVGKATGREYTRKVYFSVINGPKYEGKTREYCTLDIFPTILESLGATIEGHRLGLGTSLYGDVPTLIEKLGLRELNAELTANSKYYTEVIMSGDQTKTKNPNPESPDGEQTETVMAQPISAQFYQDNQTLFDDTDYIYNAPVDNNTYWPDQSGSDYTPQPENPTPDPGVTEPTVPETPVTPVEPPASETPVTPVEPPASETPDTPVTPDPPISSETPVEPTPDPTPTPGTETGAPATQANE